ncbi:Alpha/Beta hydrolase protein [Talaromyces proteolyticus]|uniref:Alpha/Beta hydrolase protein n=1 Tax=Talaromyces proteolyticus TaxID=1131652 RepID=A0AAD4KHR0_9EURO|nr:Alpha/Beta hydrolase protein [Talaromyces proteolyticus]KAH8691472.1 Alpha/Beta hydrolase protein [Talaromyces proteolyticus]
MSAHISLTKDTRSISFDGMKIIYDSYGVGYHTLVFIHGWSCNRELWSEQEPIYNKYRSILVDLPGHGASEAPLNVDYNNEMFARAINEILQHERITQAVLIGHSMGGPIATMVLRLFPHTVSGIFYVDSFWKYPQAYLTLKEREELKAKLWDDEKFFSIISALFRDNDDMDNSVRNTVTKVMMTTPKHVRVSVVATDAVPHALGYDDVFNIPAVHVVSERYSNIDKMWLHHLPQLHLAVWREAGHFLQIENPEALNKLVNKFLVDNNLLQNLS